MSVSVQFNYFILNKTAKKAMERYVGFLEKAFEQYRDLWEDYIKLQEKHEQCNVSSPFQVTIDEPCGKAKDELTIEKQLNSSIILQENDDALIVGEKSEPDSLHTDAQNFLDDIETNLMNLSEDFLDNSPSKSPVFFKTYPKTSSTSTKKFVSSFEVSPVCNNSAIDTKMFRKNEKIPSKCNQKLEISSTYHVETTFLPNGKKLKQSRLVFHPIKDQKQKIQSHDINKLKPADTMQKAKQNITNILDIKTPINIEDNATKANETFFDDVMEISPTQKDVQSNSRYCLNFKSRVPKQIKNSPNKSDVDFNIYLSPSSGEVTYDTSLEKDSNIFDANKDNVNIHNHSLTQKYNEADVKSTSSTVNQRKDQIVKDEVQNISRNLNDLFEDETFFSPAEQTVNKNDMYNFDLDDTENKPPAKRLLLNKFHMTSKKKGNVTEQLNMRCKADRAKLNGWSCWECKEYYQNLSLSKKELQKRKNQCSRHRQKYERPSTPEGFWNPEFPETLSSTYRHNKN
ncbi:uncharacterized protein LOC105181519 [Harpegnathos saltator]|uniref:Retinoblastoma-binding protein 8 n=1 Tax=Harpegnathos saltator TaxID=610380 RepID=E2BD86_HARSA|nr:uncharacterized protein LOC105181519 [Harpegnathos saltator]XP_011136644.1 uncharacterized protein LOC105181519 [Harpegnathos saltator]EFN86314.1 Retinoblastoma-binding protein 8 [Harpegnathos saltator]